MAATRTTPRPRGATARPFLAASLARRGDALAAHLADALQGDGHAIHQARVATRRLREMVPVVREAHAGRHANLKGRLRRATRALGPVRELDVALGLLDERAAGRPAPGVVAVRAHLVQARGTAYGDLQDAFDGDRAPRLLSRLADVVAALEKTGRGAELPKRVTRALAQRVLDRAKETADAVSASGALLIVERVHAVRIAVKRLRYALELAGELRLARTAALVSSLRAIQDILGALHDLDVLRGRIGRVAREVPAESIVARELDAMIQAVDADVRQLHARYLRAAGGLVRLTDRVRDRVAPCLDRSISISFATPSPKSAGRSGPTTRSGRSPTTGRRSGAAKRKDSSRSTRGRT